MENVISETSPVWSWPFGIADLTAGLRRMLKDPSLIANDVQALSMPSRTPSIGRVQAIMVEYEGKEGKDSIHLVLKEPHGTTRTGLAGAGRREVGVYQSLASQLPVKTPALISGAPNGDWLILEQITPIKSASRWTADDYEDAIKTLTKLHDRFWNLGEDLNAFPWLGRPLDLDYEVHLAAAASALEHIVEEGHPQPFAGAPERMTLLNKLINQADRVVQPLRNLPATFLHGDYWPGNIAVVEQGDQVVYDWQLAGVGPGVMDVLVFVNKSVWWFDDLPMTDQEIVTRYRTELAMRNGVEWSDHEWSEQWDHALMWRFLQEWVDLLAVSPESLLVTRAEQLDSVWLGPVTSAVDRRLMAS